MDAEFAAFDPQLVLLDLSLPFFNGYHWCRELRKVSKVPILFLSSAADSMNQVMAMNLGGDDFLAKPFDLPVLSAKVQALVRRAYDFGAPAHLLSCGGGAVNLSDGTLRVDDGNVELTKNEFKILRMLLENRGRTVSRTELMARLILLWAAFIGIFAAVFSLYGLPLESIGYAAALCAALGLAVFLVEFVRFLRRHRELRRLLAAAREQVLPLPPSSGPLESDYQALLDAVCRQRTELLAQSENRRRDALDFYTLWVHQIKTPIAAGRLLLQSKGGPDREEALGAELLKIEEYVELALNYLRLDGDGSDFVFRRCELDGVVRACVRKYARLFILKKITLEFTQTHRTVLTDEKWLEFAVGQLLSNALKYTPPGGTIRIYGDGETLAVADTGIGIRPEDLPRIFEKGFTGCNGREEKKSTGIGLYLCKRVLDQLGHGVTAASRPGSGTVVRLILTEGGRVAE